jgi:glycosyltransferase involved in cell wall biosynthesis
MARRAPFHVDQVLAGATPGDAVTESALLIRGALRRAVESELYAYHLDGRLGDTVGWTGHYPIARDRRRHDVILYHVSISQAGLNDFVVRRHEKLMLAYHNITPAEHFAEVDPTFALYLSNAREELPHLLAHAGKVVADSEFNAAELRALGRDDVSVVPPPLNLDRLLHTPPDPVFEEAIRRRAPGGVVLFVGQLLPHKRPDLLLGAHHLLTTNHSADTTLVLAGSARNLRYRSAVHAYAHELALENVWITGELTDAQLSALYRQADVFVTPSEHEGFCVPLIEAMSFDLPIVARDFGAVAETAGDAALVLPADSGARELAEAIHLVLTDEAWRDHLVERGRVRRELYRPERTLPLMLGEILDFVKQDF